MSLDISFDRVFSVDQLINEEKGKISKLVDDTSESGLFFLYSKNNNLLYIGWSINIRGNIKEYIMGRASNVKKFRSDIYAVKILYYHSFDAFRDTHQDCNDIQFYLIDKLNPRFNGIESVKKAYIDSERYINNQCKEWEDMKTKMTPVEVLAWFENGKPHPLRFKFDGETIKIDQVLSVTEEKLAGNKMLYFRCQSEIDGVLKPFEIKFEVNTCKWFLWKM